MGGGPKTQDASTAGQAQTAPEQARPATLAGEELVKVPGQDGDLLLPRETVVEVEWSNRSRLLRYVDEGGYQLTAEDVGNGSPYSWGDGRIVRVLTDKTPPRPDPRVEVVARVLAAECGSDTWQAWASNARSVLTALDAMGADQ